MAQGNGEHVQQAQPPPQPLSPHQQQQALPSEVERPHSVTGLRQEAEQPASQQVASAGVPAQQSVEATLLQGEADTAAAPVVQSIQCKALEASSAAVRVLEPSAPTSAGPLRVPPPPPPPGVQADGDEPEQHSTSHLAAAPPPPPPPAVAKLLPAQAARSSVVKPGVSWKALVVGAPEEAAPQPAMSLLGGAAGDRPGKRGRSRKQDGKKDVAAAAPLLAAPVADTAAPAPAPLVLVAATSKQRSKRAPRPKKGQAEEGMQQEVAEGEPALAAATGAGSSRSQPARPRGRGRGREAGEQPAGQAADAEEAGEGLAAAELDAVAAQAVPSTLPQPAAVAEAVPLLEPHSISDGGSSHAGAGDVPALQPSTAAAAAVGGTAAPIMPPAFGWSSPLADEVAKLQLTASGGSAQQSAAGGDAGVPLVASHMALLPPLGHDLHGAAALQQHQPPQDSMADVITSLPADLTLDLGPAASGGAPPPGMGQPFPSASPPPPSASPPPFPGGLFPSASSSWQAQPPSRVRRGAAVRHRRPVGYGYALQAGLCLAAVTACDAACGVQAAGALTCHVCCSLRRRLSSCLKARLLPPPLAPLAAWPATCSTGALPSATQARRSCWVPAVEKGVSPACGRAGLWTRCR